MASKQNPDIFQCSGCEEEFDLDSKTLPCLHSFCRSCLDRYSEGHANGIGQCPECHEPLTLHKLSLSPFLAKSLRCQQLASADWKCDFCLADGIESIATNWCHDCQKLFCANCSRCHKKFQKECHRQHSMKDLAGIERSEALKTMIMDICSLHQKEKDLFCERCNVCFCDTCYQKHSADSPGCSSQPLSVKEKALKQKLNAPTLAKEMDHLEMSLRRLNEKTRTYAEQLSSDCDSKCQKLWQNLEEIIENAKQKSNELCEEMRQITAEQVRRWRHLLEANENILKQLEIWRLNLHHLMGESQHDLDVVCGLRSLRSKLSSPLHKSVRPEEKCQLEVTIPNWWLQVLKQLKSDPIGTASLTFEELPSQNLLFDKQWNLRESNLWINSIHVSREDDHVFVCDSTSIIEFTDSGEFVCKCVLFDGKNKFYPTDMCSVSPDIFVVCGWRVQENKLIFLERKKIPPYLLIQQIVNTKKGFCSLCQINKTIFACDWVFQIDSFTKEGEKLKTIKTGGSWCKYWPLIRVDPSTGNFWGTRENYSEMYCFDPNGEKLQSVETGEKITDFCVTEFGYFYYCNQDGIFSLLPKKIFFKFEKKSEFKPQIFILRNRIFVSLMINGKYFVKIFKILD